MRRSKLPPSGPEDVERGWGPWKVVWCSICSKHGGGYDSGCYKCQAGVWKSAWRSVASTAVYELCPALWRWWVNRR